MPIRRPIKAAAHLFRATAPIYFKGFITFFFLQSFPVWQMLSIRERSSVIMFSLTSTKEFSALTKICLISSSVRCLVLHGLEIIVALCFCKKESFDLLFLVILKRFALHRKPNKLYWFQKEGVWSSCQLSPLK